MSTLSLQIDYDNKKIYVLDEILGKPESKENNTPKLSQKVRDKYLTEKHTGGLLITHHSKEKQNNVKSRFSLKIRIFYFPPKCKKVRFTTAFIDVQQLAAEHTVQDNNGHYWIRKTRQKTNNMCNIPLLDIPWQFSRNMRTTQLASSVAYYSPFLAIRI